MVWLKASFLFWTGAFVGGLQLLWVPGCTVAVVVAAGVHVFCQQYKKSRGQWHVASVKGKGIQSNLSFFCYGSCSTVCLTVTVTVNVFYRKLLSQLRWRGTRA
jgi:hypothetical protein